MKTNYFLLVSLLVVTGCNPFNQRQQQTKKEIQEADKIAQKHVDDYREDLRSLEPYEVYRYKDEPKDPFRLREFLVELLKKKSDDEIKVGVEAKSVCEPPKCVPPSPHVKEVLENYDLEDLVFVGTLGKENEVALIRTPDLGVLRAKVGGYMGTDNGKILTIKETAILLQEKAQIGGIWKNKKTLLMITQ